MGEMNSTGTINIGGVVKHKVIRIPFHYRQETVLLLLLKCIFFLSDIGAYFETILFKYSYE